MHEAKTSKFIARSNRFLFVFFLGESCWNCSGAEQKRRLFGKFTNSSTITENERKWITLNDKMADWRWRRRDQWCSVKLIFALVFVSINSLNATIFVQQIIENLYSIKGHAVFVHNLNGSAIYGKHNNLSVRCVPHDVRSMFVSSNPERWKKQIRPVRF